jgi:quercetin dioxygenase-like cupin family protein
MHPTLSVEKGRFMLRYSGGFLAIMLAACASPPPAKPQVDIAGLPSPLEAGWKGQKVCEVLQDNAEVRVLRCTFLPGVGHERHFHAPHFGYAITGGKVHIKDASGERDAVTPDGYSWWAPDYTIHENRNIGDTTMVYLIVEPKSAQKRKP